MTTYHSFQMEKLKEAGHYHAVSCFEAHMNACTGPSDRFVLGEPVTTGVPLLKMESNRGRVFWITRIIEDDKYGMGPQVWLTFQRHGGHGDFSVDPTDLRKIPAMLRIAHEADLA